MFLGLIVALAIAFSAGAVVDNTDPTFHEFVSDAVKDDNH